MSYCYCPCSNSDCIKEWEEYYDPNDKDLMWTHCETDDCHNGFFLHKNGYICDECDIKVCEGCSDNGHHSNDWDDGFTCEECIKDINGHGPIQ